MFCNTIGALLTNRVVQLSCPQPPLSGQSAAKLLQGPVDLPVGSLLSSCSVGPFLWGGAERVGRGYS